MAGRLTSQAAACAGCAGACARSGACRAERAPASAAPGGTSAPSAPAAARDVGGRSCACRRSVYVRAGRAGSRAGVRTRFCACDEGRRAGPAATHARALFSADVCARSCAPSCALSGGVEVFAGQAGSQARSSAPAQSRCSCASPRSCAFVRPSYRGNRAAACAEFAPEGPAQLAGSVGPVRRRLQKDL